jgi:DNA-directed RNA polymerase subunit M/transcription elongation factor TFIIS
MFSFFSSFPSVHRSAHASEIRCLINQIGHPIRAPINVYVLRVHDELFDTGLAAQRNDEKSSLQEAGQNVIYPVLQQAALAATTFSLLNQYETDHHPDSRLNLADYQKLNVTRSLCERLHNMYPNMRFLPSWLIQPPPLSSPTLWPGILPSSNNNSNNNNNDKQNNNNNNNMNDSSERRASKKNVTKKKSAKTSVAQDPPNDDPANSSTANRSSGTKRDGKQRSFICRTCNRGFAYKHVLQNHERTHTGEKPFECPHCKKRYIF